MQGIQVGEKLQLDDVLKTDRGPVVKVKAVGLPHSDSVYHNTGWYGLTVKQHKARKNGEVFDCYLGDFSDVQRKSVRVKGRDGEMIEINAKPGWMEFVDPADRKRWEEWKAKAQKAKA
jgi:hypothetical protein